MGQCNDEMESTEPETKSTPTDNYGYPKNYHTALPQIIAVMVKNMILLAFGTSLGFATILIPAVKIGGSDASLNLTDEEISWISSINLICVPLGCIASGSVTTAIGRKKAMLLVNIPFVIAWIIFYFADSVEMLYVGLVMSGIAGGLMEAPVLVYVGEITQPHLRGMLSSTSTLCVIIGIFLQFLLGILMSWRYAALVNAVIPVIAIICIMFLPESPHWLIQKGRDDDAKKSLQWLRGWTDAEVVDAEYQDIYKSKHSLMSNKDNNPDGFKQSIRPYFSRAFLYGYAMVSLAFFLGHFSGMTTLQTYAIVIFDTLNVPLSPDYATLILGIAQILGAVLSVSLVHFVGKRPLTFFSTLGCAACYITVATYTFIENGNIRELSSNTTQNISQCVPEMEDCSQENPLSWIPLTFLIGSAFISHTGIRILPWVLVGEVYALETRAIASGLSGGTGYLMGFAANKLFLTMISGLTLAGTFWLYALFSIVGAIIFYIYLPETEGYTLPEIEDHFRGVKKLPNKVYKKGNKISNETIETGITDSMDTITERDTAHESFKETLERY